MPGKRGGLIESKQVYMRFVYDGDPNEVISDFFLFRNLLTGAELYYQDSPS